MNNLWTSNHPRDFWQCQPNPSSEIWQDAIVGALPALGLTDAPPDADSILTLTLGEARFGPDHWRLSLPKRTYYLLKPFIPRVFRRLMRRAYHRTNFTDAEIPWPVDARYVTFLWEVLARVLQAIPKQQLTIKSLWPEGQRFALVLTHDVETQTGLDYVRKVADLEESLDFRSSFNFVPEDYPIGHSLVDELHQRGFEVGIHGLKHDGKLFSSRAEFERRVVQINQHLEAFGAVGFRSPLTHRNPEWMQSLAIEYDLSFFDTDPFEPIPGGTMSIWPFFLGNFVELPYTLVQDYTLTAMLEETTPRLWLEKVDFIDTYHGMALVNSHPDYLRAPATWEVYKTFLSTMKKRGGFWHALPRAVAHWWRDRSCDALAGAEMSTSASLVNGQVMLNPIREPVMNW